MRRSPHALLLLLFALALPARAATPMAPDELAQAAWTNAARHDLAAMCALCVRFDPSIDCASWGTSKSLPPFHVEPRLADAARFHAHHLQQGPCFQHDSCCTLEKTADGLVRCKTPECSTCPGKTECAGTPPEERYPLLGYGSFSGENIAVGYGDSLQVTCGWLNSPGHRANILGPHDELGVGLFPDSNGCIGMYWAQGFGTVEPPPDPGYVTSGGVMPGAPFGPAGKPVSAIAFVADPAGESAAPQSVKVVVDGRCVPLAAEIGQGGKALYAQAFDAAAGCHQAWFLAVDAHGARHVYPPQGAVAFSVGAGASCPPATERTPAACEGVDACSREGEKRACYTGAEGTEGVGRCHGGARTCTDGAFGACEAEQLPGDESCNGLDDDCNGQVDDAPKEAGSACDTGLPGRCRQGHSECQGGSLTCVPNQLPADETCNGEDDDCDGEVDDGLGTIVCGTGACQRIVAVCHLGAPQTCTPGAAQATDTCGNALDDDCDGTPDQGCPCTTGASRPCYGGPATTLGVGRCHAGTQRCEAGAWGACEGQQLPALETCNGEDDDCNRVVDDGFGREACGSGACRVTVARCKAGQAQTCEPIAPATELCNGKDDSCDGRVDEGCVCRAGQQEACSSAWAHAGVGRCKAGVRTCLPDGSGWTACQGEVLAKDEVCHDGADDDCDGLVDEDCPPLPPAPVDDSRGSAPCGCASDPASAIALSLLALAIRRRR